VPKVFNTITKSWQNVSSFEARNPIFSSGPEEAEPAVVVEGYKADATDGDGDGFVQDGTPFERPEGTDLTEAEQVEAVSDTPKPKKRNKSSK
jgi:hypothetical protein